MRVSCMWIIVLDSVEWRVGSIQRVLGEGRMAINFASMPSGRIKRMKLDFAAATNADAGALAALHTAVAEDVTHRFGQGV